MRLGIFGGTFDPVHVGHLVLAEIAREQFRLDQIWLIPAFIPPQKQDRQISQPKDRLEMLRLATAGHSQFKVSDLELKREGPSYTVDTLREIAALQPDAELFLLIGGDSLADLTTWRDPPGILELATILAANRGRGIPEPTAELQQLCPNWTQRIDTFAMPSIEISATDLRERTASGKSIRFQTPRAVEMYIREHRLYS